MIYTTKQISGIITSVQLNGKDIIETSIPDDSNTWSFEYEEIWKVNNNRRMKSVCDFLNGKHEEMDIIVELNNEISRLSLELEKSEEIIVNLTKK